MTSERVRWSRRALLGAAALGGLTACGPARPDSVPSRTPTTPSLGPSSSPSLSVSASPPWAQLSRSIGGRLVLPDDSGYSTLRLTENPRYDAAQPLALLRPQNAQDVATGLKFAQDNDVPLAVRSGGHSYPGWSSGGTPPALVIDMRSLSSIDVSGTQAVIGSGAALGDVYATIGGQGRALAAGSCPTVGISGLTLGGGVGVVTRAYGLTCDALTSAQVVLASGDVVTASEAENADLFWGLRGGGGGHLGVVTSLTFATSVAPALSTAYLQWPLSAAAELVPAWFDWMGSADPRLWSTLKLLGGTAHPGGPIAETTITWTGPDSAFGSQVHGLLAQVPAPTVDVTHRRGYADAMQAFGGSGAREAFAATSHVPYVAPDANGVDTLVQRASEVPAQLHEAGVSIDALGGHVADLAPSATAFVHRQALATVQYTATYDSGGPETASSYVTGFRSAMTPTWGDHAYVNYSDATLTDPGDAYFGANWPRLQQLRSTYDPHGLFTQPQ